MAAELVTTAATAAERTSMTEAGKQTWWNGIEKSIEEDQIAVLVSRVNEENGETEEDNSQHAWKTNLETMCFRKAGSKKQAEATSGTRENK